jgi:hypothetical protein
MQSLLSNTLVKNEVLKSEVLKSEVLKNDVLVFKNEVLKNVLQEVVQGIARKPCLCGVKRGLRMPLECLKNDGIMIDV